MKRKVEVLCILLLCALSFSCGNKSSLYHQIVSLDALADSAADTALVQLRSMENQVMAKSENIIRRWQLACIKAQDKAYIPHVSDSVIKDVVAYFERHGTVEEKIESYYYLGSVYRDLHDSPKSLTSFLTVLEIANKQKVSSPQILANANSQLAEIYRLQFDYIKALECAKKGLKVSLENGFSDPVYFMDVATCYKELEIKDSTIHYYNRALGEILKRDEVPFYAECVAEILAYFSSIKDYERSVFCKKLLSGLKAEERPKNYFPATSVFFEIFGPMDSAIIYNKYRLTSSVNSFGKRDASFSLFTLYDKRGDYDKALRYAKIYAEAEDSIREMLKIEQTRNANNEFQYRRDMEAEVANERRAARAERWLMAVVGGSVILLLGGLLLHVDRRRRLMQRLLEQERAIARQRTELEAARSRMEELKRELKAKNVARETVMKMMLTAEAGHSCPDVVDLFRKAARGQAAVGDDDWLRLAVAVEEMHPGFADTMIERWPDIGPDCQHIAYLLQIGMEPGDIMRVMNMPKSSLYRKMKQTRAILFGE